MESHGLTFAALEKRIEELPEHPSNQVSPSRRARWGNGIGTAAGLLGLIIGKTMPGNHAVLVATVVLLVVEVAAFVVALTAELPSLNLRPSRERREFAEVLDFDPPTTGT